MPRSKSAQQRHPGLAALIEVGILFLPGIPAFFWLWPTVTGTPWVTAVNVLAYLYLLAGSLWIGRRRWDLAQLGFNRRGLGLSLVCGLFLFAGRTLVILAVQWPREPDPLTLSQAVGDVLFYFGLVAVIEEYIFRGLVFRALDEWRGARWAIWGSTAGFILFHISWHSPLQLLAALIIGLIFATIRWRAGGIVGLIFTHGLIDVGSVWLLPDLHLEELGRPEILQPVYLLLGYAFILGIPLYLWLLHQRLFPVNNKAVVKQSVQKSFNQVVLAFYRPNRLLTNYLANPALRFGLIPYAILIALWTVKNMVVFILPGTTPLDKLIPIPLPRLLTLRNEQIFLHLLLFVGIYMVIPFIFAGVVLLLRRLLRLEGLSIKAVTSFFMFVGGAMSLLALLADAFVEFSPFGQQLGWLLYAHPLVGLVEIAYLTAFTRRLAGISWWRATAVIVPAFLVSIGFRMLFMY